MHPLPRTWLARCRSAPGKIALRHKRRGIWHATTWSEYLDKVMAVALALEAQGLDPGEVVSIVSESRPEFLFVDMAVQSMGLVSHGIYPTCTAEDIDHQLREAGSRVVFVENAEQAAKVLQAGNAQAHVRLVVVFDARGLRELDDSRLVAFNPFIATAEQHPQPHVFQQRLESLDPAGIAFLSSTAGTTGQVRLVAISHEGACRRARQLAAALDTEQTPRVLSFVPLANTGERMFSAALPLLREVDLHFAESPATVANDLREVQPHWVHAPPRFWEKLQAGTDSASLLASPVSQRLYHRAVKQAAGGLLPHAARRQMRRSLGLAQTRLALSGGAGLATGAAPWYAGLGIGLIDVYESAECCGPAFVIGAKGGLSKLDTAARVSEAGELQLCTDALAAGYWRGGRLEALELTQDGWLRSGDMADVSGATVLRVAGPLADTFTLSGGERVVPGPIENSLHANMYIAAALLAGEGRPQCACVLSLEESSVLRYAQSRGISFTDYVSLIGRPEIHELVSAQIEVINADLAEHQRIRSFQLLPRMLRSTDAEMTPLLRLQRQRVRQSFGCESLAQQTG